jgi:glucose/arabinose dehydrogenase
MAVQLASVRLRSCVRRALMVAALATAIASCRLPFQPQAESPAPPQTAQPATPIEPTPATPTDTPAATLPNALVAQWQPLSNVLLAFGSMNVTPDRVQWSSGQSSPYRLVSTEGGYLLELETRPSFYDTQNQFIKLIPKADTNGAADSIEVAFYPDASHLQRDEYIMYGSYFEE